MAIINCTRRPIKLYATLRYATLRYATLRYSTLLYATLRYSTLLYFGQNKSKWQDQISSATNNNIIPVTFRDADMSGTFCDIFENVNNILQRTIV
jgi:uncharacterized protein YjbI with pentapeptide repeats